MTTRNIDLGRMRAGVDPRGGYERELARRLEARREVARIEAARLLAACLGTTKSERTGSLLSAAAITSEYFSSGTSIIEQ
jgi:hypothetical protein